MSRTDARRARRHADDLPAIATDDDLVAWGRALAAIPAQAATTAEPAGGPPARTPWRRSQPLRATRVEPPAPSTELEAARDPSLPPVRRLAGNRIKLRRKS
ncbi:MAG: hypothetical protein ACR2LQ_05250 [Acidimicrobiales bacterium]